MSELPQAIGDADWQRLSGCGWPQLRECTYVALAALMRLDNPEAATALVIINKIIEDGAHDPATRVTRQPPEELISLMRGASRTGAA